MKLSDTGEMKDVFFCSGDVVEDLKSTRHPGNFFKMSLKIHFVAWGLVLFTDLRLALPKCPIGFPAPHFPTEHGPHLASAGGRSESVSLADSWDSSACTSLASGCRYLFPRLAAIQGSPPLWRLIPANRCHFGKTFVQIVCGTLFLEKTSTRVWWHSTRSVATLRSAETFYF